MAPHSTSFDDRTSGSPSIWRTFMKLRHYFSLFFLLILGISGTASSQADPVIGQISNSTGESFAGSISGDGRFVVFESTGNVATENPRNEDGNAEIFLFDFAQRRIFQITDTQSVLFNTCSSGTGANVRILIANKRPMISTDGR